MIKMDVELQEFTVSAGRKDASNWGIWEGFLRRSEISWGPGGRLGGVKLGAEGGRQSEAEGLEPAARSCRGLELRGAHDWVVVGQAGEGIYFVECSHA